MKVLLPQGIGDTVWALLKVQSVAAKQAPGEEIDVLVSGGPSEIESRALDFVRRFSFVDSARLRPYYIHRDPPVSSEGYYNYLQDGWHDFAYKNAAGEFEKERVCALMPNGPLERGTRIEQWLPQYSIDWNIFNRFEITNEERDFASVLAAAVGPYAVFYPGPLRGNTLDGHNRGALWRPQDWIDLGRRVAKELGLHIVVVGAPYDVDYWDGYLSPLLDGDFRHYTNLIGRTSVGQVFSVTSLAKFVISYQSGIGICSALMKTPTRIWWRPRGDSISPSTYLSFSERMASGWCSHELLEQARYKPMVYKRETVADIVSWAGRWV